MCCAEGLPRLSVITGAWQIADLAVLQKAVDSVLTQTMGDFEWIICDDGSTDETFQVLTDLAGRDSRIRLIRNDQNLGLAASLNHCLEYARGELIARQDADDVSDPRRFEKQIAFLDSHPEVDFVGSNVTLWDEAGPWRERQFPAHPQPKDFRFTMPFVHGALMFRRGALDRVEGYRVAKETRRAEDYDMLMRMYAAGLRGANLQEPLYAFLEDRAAQKRRKYRYRLDEVVVRWKGFSRLGLLPGALPYVLKPLVVGLIPHRLLKKLRQRKKF